MEELEVGSRGRAPIGIDQDDRLALAKRSAVMESLDAICGQDVLRRIAVVEGVHVNGRRGGAGVAQVGNPRRYVRCLDGEWDE